MTTQEVFDATRELLDSFIANAPIEDLKLIGTGVAQEMIRGMNGPRDDRTAVKVLVGLFALESLTGHIKRREEASNAAGTTEASLYEGERGVGDVAP